MEQFKRLKSEQQEYGKPKCRIIENIYNFFLYKLVPKEEHVLLFSLDDHIPVKKNDAKIKTEFESFLSIAAI